MIAEELASALAGQDKAAPLAERLVESMGKLMEANAAQQPALMHTMTEFLGKTLDQVRRDTARQMGREGGKASARGRAKRKADTVALDQLRDMAARCRECHYNLHGVPWTEREPTGEDYSRHKSEAHDLLIAKLVGQAQPQDGAVH
jgi:hypothetical protein